MNHIELALKYLKTIKAGDDFTSKDIEKWLLVDNKQYVSSNYRVGILLIEKLRNMNKIMFVGKSRNGVSITSIYCKLDDKLSDFLYKFIPLSPHIENRGDFLRFL